jgi:uncharacterized protein (TIGR03083 family)
MLDADSSITHQAHISRIKHTIMQQPQPILIADLFPEILEALLDLLAGLSDGEWAAPTVCPGWSVKDIAGHLLGDDVGMLSRRRDGYRRGNAAIAGWDDLVAFINRQNAEWVETARRLSPRLLCDMLRLTGAQVSAFFQSLDPFALGGPVDWAGPDPAPVWLDLAREYTERWHHQQQIREAIGKPGLMEPRYFAPALDAFVRALPHTYRNIDAAEQTLVALTITGAAGGTWFLLREQATWRLYLDIVRAPDAQVTLDQDTAWQLFTKGIGEETARSRATSTGDSRLAAPMLKTLSVIA